MIFKDLIHYCQMGEGHINNGENTYCSVVKTLKTKESTRTDTEGELSCCPANPIASKRRLRSCHRHPLPLQAPQNPSARVEQESVVFKLFCVLTQTQN